MKKLITLLFVQSILINIGQAQTSIWKVEGNGNTLYIGGTIHILRPQDYPLPVEFDSAYERADVIVLEADIKKFEEPGMAQTLMMKAMYQDEQTLTSVLSKEVYADLSRESTKLNIPLASMDKFKPSLVILSLAVMKMQQLGISADGVDKHFHERASKDSVDILFLETVEEQIDLIANMGEGNENEFVQYSLKDFEQMEKDLMEMIATWRDGSATVMLSQLDKMAKEFPALYQSLLVTRNNNWLPTIDNFLKDEKIEFIMVGTLHLYGTDGVLDKLRAKGYGVDKFEL